MKGALSLVSRSGAAMGSTNDGPFLMWGDVLFFVVVAVVVVVVVSGLRVYFAGWQTTAMTILRVIHAE